MSHRKPADLSRRALLGAASLGVLATVAEKAFGQTQNKPPFDSAIPLKDVVYYPPGLLAHIRLGEGTIANLRSATAFAALRGHIDFGDPNKGRYYQKTYTESSRFPQNGSSVARPAE